MCRRAKGGLVAEVPERRLTGTEKKSLVQGGVAPNERWVGVDSR